MRDSGIPTVVWLCPILPWINDTRENIEGILQYCVEAQVYGILCFGMGLTLRQGNREYFYQKLDQHFPGLKQRYIKTYGDAYEITSPRAGELMELLNRTCERYGMERDREKIFQYLGAYERRNEPRQLSMWD